MKANRVTWTTIILLVAIFCIGCGEKAGEGKLVPLDNDSAKSLENQSTSQQSESATSPRRTEAQEANEATPNPTSIDIKVKYEKGKVIDYALVNTIEVLLPANGTAKPSSQETFLNASQAVTVGESNSSGAELSIHTSKVTSGFLKQSQTVEEADAFLKKTAKSIEGSILRGRFDSNGRGSSLELIGSGVGLNPMGPQGGSQELMVGFMGVLLPGRPIKRGDKWSAKYDFSESASDLFGTAGAKSENSEIEISYELLDFDVSKNFARLEVKCKGAPIIKIPSAGATVRIDMKVDAIGQALIRLDDGWLQELRLETVVITEGFTASKQTIRTVTKRLN